MTTDSKLDLIPLLQGDSYNDSACDNEIRIKVGNSSISSKWAAIILNKHDINKNVLETKKSNSWQEHFHPKSTWAAMSRPKLFIFLSAVSFMVIYTNFALSSSSDDRIEVIHYSHVPGMKGYLVWSENCRMPNIDPYQKDVMKYFKREKYKPCAPTNPVTQLIYNETLKQYILSVNPQFIEDFNKKGLSTCCYESILRNGKGEQADAKISLGDCVEFNQQTSIPASVDSLIVRCHSKQIQTYINAHAMIPEREYLCRKVHQWKQKDKSSNKPTSLLLIGIDSISRINLIRSMPKTAQYLYDNEWFEMSGFNKMGDNTFPNLMALLTGSNKSTAYSKCEPTKVGGLEGCVFIWNLFQEHGFVTAYGEDETSMNTFNYLKKGFVQSPTDYYMRPYLMAAEKYLHVQRKSGLTYCLGYKHSAEHVYDYALEFVKRYKNDPFFGLFWTNTFSHNSFSDCTAMDNRMVDYLKQFASLGTLNNTIVIFFSDHGMRFGPSRSTYSGYYEERLPFLFIWLPQEIKQAHPEFVSALSINKNRLTNPYDLHMTLKHILDLSGRVKDKSLLSSAQGCSKCQTLLKPVPHNRSCEEIGIEDHWCSCIPYQNIYKNSNTVRAVAQGAINYINDHLYSLRNNSLSKICAKLQLDRIEHAYKIQKFNNNGSLDSYRVVFYTKPSKAFYEATLKYNEVTGATTVTGEISRLNSYSTDSDCIQDIGAKKYCSCIKKTNA